MDFTTPLLALPLSFRCNLSRALQEVFSVVQTSAFFRAGLSRGDRADHDERRGLVPVPILLSLSLFPFFSFCYFWFPVFFIHDVSGFH